MKRVSAIVIILALMLSGALSETALTVNDGEISTGEANAWMWLVKQSYGEIIDYYDRTLGINYWYLTYPNGQTVWDSVKADAFKQLVMIKLFCDMAEELNLSLSQEEAAKCEKTASSVTDANGFDQDELCRMLKMRLLAGKSYSYMLSLQQIDEEAIIASIDKSLFTAYEVEYLCVPYYVYARDEKARRESQSELKELRGFNGSYEDASRLNDRLICGKLTLCPADCESDKALLYAARELSVGETSGVIETDYGLFIVRLLSNADTTLYEAAVEEKLLSARKRAYRAEYNRLYTSAEYTLNAEYWDKLTP